MIFLPIAQRELRVAAAKRGTLAVRLWGAGAALVLGAMVFVFDTATGTTKRMGANLFEVLTWLVFITALSAGLTFTSDSLSEEKREGTLGFLFLTDLRGYDVVSGKLIAAGLRAFYMLLAAFPIVAVPLLMGGVTGVAFWKACLALLNALFASLIAGVFVSSISRESQKAMMGTLFLMAVWCGAGYVIDGLTSNVLFRFSSPFFVFSRPGRFGFFWEALLVNQVIAWILLAASSYFAARTWHDKPEKSTSRWAAFGHWLKYGSARRRERLRQKLMGRNPVTWLATRERWQALSFWVIAALLLGTFVMCLVVQPTTPSWAFWRFWSIAATTCTLILYIGFATQACRFFVDARRNAVLELLLSTPLDGEHIIRGQWIATLRTFGPPLLFFLAIHFLGSFIVQQSAPMSNPFKSFVVSGAHVLAIAADLATVTWFGMWMGLISKSANTAAWKTVLYVQVLPWIGLTFATGILIRMSLPAWGRVGAGWMQLFGSAMATVGSLTIDWFLYRYARRRLSTDLRQCVIVAQRGGG